MNKTVAQALVFILLLCVFAPAEEVKNLPSRYREWLEQDAVYLISREERDAFLKLAADTDRDNFIQRFWEIRNPYPGSPTNEFKEEHYRRLAYANQYFKNDAGTAGWRTEKGRIYILFGEPEQKATYYGYNKLRPMEIWFYQNSNHPSLPPYFYIVFYKPDSGGDFKLYSPYMDGPEKLVTTNPGSRLAAWKTVDQQAGREVSRTTLSLFPDEPVDTDTARSSLQSDILLSNIKGLPNLPLEKEQLNRRRELLESVSHRVILGPEFLNVVAVPFLDSDGNVDIHYMLRLQEAKDFAVGQTHDGRYYYNVDVTARVTNADGKLIYVQDRKLSKYLSQAELSRKQDATPAIEGRLPLAPGKYKIDFVLTNTIKQTAFRTEVDVAVPAPVTSGLFVTPPVPFSDAEAVSTISGLYEPFSGAGVHYSTIAAKQLDLGPGDDLKFFYQIWAPAIDPRQNHDKKLVVEYGYGRPGVMGDSRVIHDEVPREQFDKNGSMLNGKKIPIANLRPGNYRLVVTVSDPDTQQKAFASLAFRVLGTAAAPQAWLLDSSDVETSVKNGTMDYERALSYLANGDNQSGVAWLRKAVEKDPKNTPAISRLIEVYSSRQAYPDIAALYPRINVERELDEITMLRIAESLDKTGSTQQAVSLLESAMSTRPPSWPLYLALSTYYKHLGNTLKSEEMERKGRELVSTATPSS
ncbi:MAG TPA: GWxTD domain-containing protein [Terriglobales bacterium]|nr:GWxTD domain-containing protein [Terriglobales bacterium]